MKRGIPTEVGEKNREIRQQNQLIDQLEARLTRLNAWAQFEKRMDAELIAQGKDVSDPNLRYLLASRIFSSAVPPRRKDNRLKEGTGLLAIMQEYSITDVGPQSWQDCGSFPAYCWRLTWRTRGL